MGDGFDCATVGECCVRAAGGRGLLVGADRVRARVASGALPIWNWVRAHNEPREVKRTQHRLLIL